MREKNTELPSVAESVAKLDLIETLDENRYIRNHTSIRLKSIEGSTSFNAETLSSLVYQYEMSNYFIKLANQAIAEVEAELEEMLRLEDSS